MDNQNQNTSAALKGDEIQAMIFQKMTPARKLEVSMQLYWSARKLKAAGLKKSHPDWTDEQVNQKVKEIFMYAES